jgi:flagellar hook-basal body complex protein FliE
MSIPPLAAIGAIAPISSTLPTAAASSVGSSATSAASTASPAGGGSDFATMLGNGIDALSSTQNAASSLAVQAATGSLVDPAQYTAAATQASLVTQLATTVQSKAVTAFNTIMGMQA